MRFTLFSLLLLASVAFLALPSLGADVFLSPDETAVAVSARLFASTGSAKIETVGGQPAVVEGIPWLHPRSYVTVGNAIAPVGFLGAPILFALLVMIFGQTALFLFTPLLVLSVVFPLWSFSSSWGRIARFGVITGWLFFPTVILYANRGLFPNLIVVCFAVWSCWLLWKKPKYGMIPAGILAGIALTIRPTEIFWIAPWLFVAAKYPCHPRVGGDPSEKKMDSRLHGNDIIGFIAPLLLIISFAAIVGHSTYGQWSVSGYQLRDPIVLSIDTGETINTTLGRSQGYAPTNYSWPFGFHPRNVWWNVRSYLIYYFFPWALILVAAAWSLRKNKSARSWLILSIWTTASLCLVYGQGLYQDHVRLNEVSIGNSFLRYLLPVSVISAFALGWIVNRLRLRFGQIGTAGGAFIISLLVLFGIWTAFVRDDEGLKQDRLELARYSSVRQAAIEEIPGSTVISDRSDKIFFPAFRVTSPMPSNLEIIKAAGMLGGLSLYVRTLDQDGMASWLEKGIFLDQVFTSGNESLYRVTTTTSQ